MDILLASGEDRVITFTVSINGEILNLTNYTSHFFVKNKISEPTPIITKAGTITSAVDGELTITLDSADTDITPDNYNYELRVVDSSENKYHVGSGNLIIKDVLEIPA